MARLLAGATCVRRRTLLAMTAGGLLSACAQPPRPPAGKTDHWSGRLAVQVEDAAHQSFNAGFELEGNPDTGELTLLSPLGNIIATLGWSPGHAQLQHGTNRKESTSLQALVFELTGSDLPIAALFGWLKGEAVQAAGWQADLSAISQGRLTAMRQTPAPQTTLRVVLSP